MAGTLGLHRRGSVRFNVTVAATTIAAASILLVGAGLVVVVHRTLDSQIVATLNRELAATKAGLAEGLLPGASAAAPGSAIQVVTVIGSSVVASSGSIQGLPPISQVLPGSQATVVPISRAFAARSTLNAARGLSVVAVHYGAVVVYAAASTRDVTSTTRLLILQLFILVLPSVIVLTLLISWWVIGRALRPVEAIRREVDDISTTALTHRVSIPPGDDEIARLAATMNSMLSRLEGASLQQRRFVADASHELRSPLASIMMQVELAQLHPESVNVEQMTGIVADEAGRLDRLVDDLLLLAKADEQAIEVSESDVDFDDLLLAEASRLRSVGRVSVETTGIGPVRVRGDRELLRRAIRNLVDNAERYATSSVRLGCTASPAGAIVTVGDDGKGIAPELHDTLFQRFARGDASRVRGTGGTGLGLSIVAEIIAAHHGTVTVTNDPGAVFQMVLPCEPDDEAPAGEGS